MRNQSTGKSAFKAGMYLLENITSGMYNDPLAIYREYVQNAVDSIDVSGREHQKPFVVRVKLEPGDRRLVIRDNGEGIPATVAEHILSSIGSSKKKDPRLRGFRGIGRLGGIAFSDKALFKTKARGENLESIQEWDCKTLREVVGKTGTNSGTLEQLFRHVTHFHQEHSAQTHKSYFEVSLHGVSSFKNHLFDILKVRRYLSQVAPVPFTQKEFSFGPSIDRYLRSKLSNYRKYEITLNGETIHKPYCDSVKITKCGSDIIEGIKFFEIEDESDLPLAYGWYGQRRELLGSIVKGDDSSGIRVRVKNILLGDSHLLDECFREARFNGYVIGEIHVDSHDLIPNSRRDDFVDNRTKAIFYNRVEQKVGLPISKEIRACSRLHSSPANTSSPEGKIVNSYTILHKQSSGGLERSGSATLKQEVLHPQTTNEAFKPPISQEANLPGEQSCHSICPRSFLETLTDCCKGCDRLGKLLMSIAGHRP
jgi:hypothetical protein